MENKQFDALTRRLSEGESSRRQTLCMLGGALFSTALGAVAACIGFADDTEARAKPSHEKAKKHKHHEAPSQPAPAGQRVAKSQTHLKSGGVQSEGKNKGKGKGNGKGKGKGHKPPSLPPGCEDCTECQMCKRGACVPDPALERVRCQGSGATCGYCQAGVCTPSEERPCQDGVCPRKGQCCPEEGTKQCIDHDLPRGFYCVDKNVCCPDTERTCASGSCLPRTACCPEQKRCGPTLCVGQHECCPGQKQCANGACVAADTCCPEQWTCADGSCMPQDQCCPDEQRCPDGSCLSRGVCCRGQRQCNDGSCVGSDECCPSATPCNSCQVRVCVDGEYVCRPGPDGTNCQMFPGDAPGFCCHGQCTREQIVCPAYPWRAYNPNTCLCECTGGSIDVPGSQRLCCPAGYPWGSSGSCVGDDPSQWTCYLGYHVCGEGEFHYPGYPCCRDN
jgi:hypothetical protein